MTLDLDARTPPHQPAHVTWHTVACKLRPATDLLLREQADRERTTVSHLLRTLVEEAVQPGGRWPADVTDWLVKQAAQCGCPGDVDQAVIEVVRHLAVRWPNGGRLNS